MPLRARLFATSVIVAGAIILFPFSLLGHLAFSPHEIAGYLLLVFLGIVAEALPVRYQVAGSQAATSISFIPLFAIVVLFPGSLAVFAVFLIVAPAEFLVHRAAAWKSLFNIAQISIATKAATIVYHYAYSVLPSYGISQLTAFIILAFTFFVTNIAIVGIYISVSTSTPFADTVRRVVGAGGSNLFYDVLVSPLALLVAFVYKDIGIIGVIILVLPLLIIRHSYLAMLQLQYANTALLTVLVKAIETRDPYTSGHSLRVSILARAIAEDIGLRGSKVDQVERAALLHDIGKVDGIYAELIQKPHALSTEEVRVIRTHATKGADFLGGLHTFSDFVLSGIRHHHEKYDGTGYPAGLAGDAIPLAARIIQIADSIDAMLSDRPYRPALSVSDVYSELKRCSGTQFDPGIADMILQGGTLERALPLLREHGAATAPVEIQVVNG
jgi:putative nucleotidyltransferase with HDIG domain